MTRPKPFIKESDKHKHTEGYCKVCGHKTNAGITVGLSKLNKQYQGKKLIACTKCNNKKHAGKDFGRVAIEVFGLKDWSQTTNTEKGIKVRNS